jgi:hypothetical protein
MCGPDRTLRGVSDFESERFLAWLRRLRGDRSQDAFLDAVAEVTGWRPDRTRYSKYENGIDPMGKTVRGYFLAYADALGAEPPDFTPPAPILSLEERAVIAAEESARAALRQADAMELHVALLARQVIAAEAIAASQAPGLVPSGEELLRQAQLLQAWGRSSLDRTPSQAPRGDPVPAGER